MSKLIKITTNEEGKQLVSARELHEFLKVKSKYADWIKNRIKKYEFIENVDYITVSKILENGGRENDHAITTEIAKELSMVENNDKGSEARKYFIQVEKAWNSPEMIMKRALEIASKQVENLMLENKQKEQIIGELKPKADYTDLILKNKGLVTTTQIAKDYGMSAQELNKTLHELGVQYKQSGQWLLYSKYHDSGYTHSETINITRTGGFPDISMITKWTMKGRLFLYNLLKDNSILPSIEREVV